VASSLDFAAAKDAPTSWVQSILNRSSLILLLLLLVPSLVQMWQHSDMPRFGDFHDDSVYYVTAKSIADGGGYRIESLPGEPAQS